MRTITMKGNITMTKVLSVSNNNYILKPGDLVKVIKEKRYVLGPIIKVNSIYEIKETWDDTDGSVVLKKKTELNDFVVDPCDVDKVLNYKKSKEAA
jgi:hypothetical protein